MFTVGLFSIGLDTYWDQLEGLFERLRGYHETIRKKIDRLGGDVIDGGLVDNPEDARKAGDELHRSQVDLVFLYVSTYALSSTVLPVAQRVNVPVIILNLQPTPAIDYESFNRLGDQGKMTGGWLTNPNL